MVYECLQCQKPQVAGATSCPDCGASFTGAVPDDAEMQVAEPIEPHQSMLEPSPFQSTAPPLPDPMTAKAPPSSQWSMPTPSYSPAPVAYQEERRQNPLWLWIGIPIGVIALCVILFLMFNAGQAPPPAPAYVPPTATSDDGTTAPPNAPPLVANPTSGNSTPTTDSTSAQTAPVGHWMAKSFQYYEFNNDGTGSSGSMNAGKPAQSFSWSMVKNEINLTPTTGGSAQHLPFTYGPDSTSLYIRQPGGQWLAFSKVGS